ncbi:MAG: 16S rRNA (adenine(1518)-N(6)/adenine(1519)-N(6))-dimethyltransferase RsmA [Terriglobia bacterium]
MNRSRRRPKLGQHFLSQPDFCRRIADSLAIAPGDLVVEIGPGRGAMTRLLAGRGSHLTAVEIDPSLAASLRKEFEADDRVEILEQDILKAALGDLCRLRRADHCFVFGNLPYYITSPILHHLFAERSRIRRMTLLVQREVAERLTAAPGCRDYGYLSVLAQCSSRPQILFGIPPGVFSPPPKVDSALVDFPMAARFPAWEEPAHAAFLRFTGHSFGQKRKSLLNNLSSAYPRPRVRRAIESLGFGEFVRAEQISLEGLATLFDALA